MGTCSQRASLVHGCCRTAAQPIEERPACSTDCSRSHHVAALRCVRAPAGAGSTSALGLRAAGAAAAAAAAAAGGASKGLCDVRGVLGDRRAPGRRGADEHRAAGTRAWLRRRATMKLNIAYPPSGPSGVRRLRGAQWVCLTLRGSPHQRGDITRPASAHRTSPPLQAARRSLKSMTRPSCAPSMTSASVSQGRGRGQEGAGSVHTSCVATSARPDRACGALPHVVPAAAEVEGEALGEEFKVSSASRKGGVGRWLAGGAGDPLASVGRRLSSVPRRNDCAVHRRATSSRLRVARTSRASP